MESREVLDQVLEQDPFKQNNLDDYVVTEFVSSMTCKELDFLRVDWKSGIDPTMAHIGAQIISKLKGRLFDIESKGGDLILYKE